MTERLLGRCLLVTGGSAGIGRAVAQGATARGANVACLARDPDRLRATTEPIGALAVPVDVRDEAAVQGAVAVVAERFGRIDGLINCAGVLREGVVAETRLDDWRRMFEVNVLGLLNVTQAAMPLLRSQRTSDIVNLSSMGGRRVARTDTAVYSGTKFAVHAISEGLRRELHADGVRVSVVAPGAVDTEFGLSTATAEEADEIRCRRARIGLSADAVAEQVLHLLAQPPEVAIHEIALTSMQQPPS